jgi:hypothetical protein
VNFPLSFGANELNIQPMKTLQVILATLILRGVSIAQIPSPKYEGHWKHLFSRHRDADNLEDRYRSLGCALVLIQAGTRLGTGFYVDAEGDVVTASHVFGDRSFNEISPTSMQILLQNVPTVFAIKDVNGEFNVPSQNVSANADDWAYDLAVLHTKRPTNCWLGIGDDKAARPGEHVLTLGFPGLAFGSLTLYSGIMSARLRADILIGTTLQGKPIKPANDYLRVQMPISPGISGAPIIDDENRVIGVVTTAGVWRQDLEQLTEFQRMRDSQPTPAPPPGIFDLGAATAHLALILHDFASPGYGDAVPLSYLQTKLPTSALRHEGSSH